MKWTQQEEYCGVLCQLDMRCVLCHENVRNTWNELVDVFIHSCTYTYIQILASVLNYFIHNLLFFLFYWHLCVYRVPCLYNAVQYNITLHTPLQERRHNINNQSIHPQKSLLPNGRAMWCLLWIFWGKFDRVLTASHYILTQKRHQKGVRLVEWMHKFRKRIRVIQAEGGLSGYHIDG